MISVFFNWKPIPFLYLLITKTPVMKILLQLEELALLIISIYLLYSYNVGWWVYLILVFGPDLGMIGYLINARVGAISYNLVHHKAVAILVFGFGMVLQAPIIQIAGIVLFGHSSMDRVFGYGLKYFSGFKDTHLGTIGKEIVPHN